MSAESASPDVLQILQGCRSGRNDGKTNYQHPVKTALLQEYKSGHNNSYADFQSLAKSGKTLEILYRVLCYTCLKLICYK
jgi:hypothetical protein